MPVTLVIGRPWSHTVMWQNPDGSAIDTTGMGVDAALQWDRQAAPLAVAVARDDAAGTHVLSLTAEQTAGVPAGGVATSRISFTDLGGQTHDYDEPLLAVRP